MRWGMGTPTLSLAGRLQGTQLLPDIFSFRDDKMELTRFPAHVLLSDGSRFKVGW
jgi:hypothetical protein